MPTAVNRAPKWTEEEIEKGEDILSYIKNNIDTTRVAGVYAQASMAARALGLITKEQTFRNLPPKIKSYLEYVWWLDSPKGREYLTNRRIAGNLAQMKEDWEALYEKNDDFRRAMDHPDDEKDSAD